jgi:hypothetical protein
MKKIIAVLLGFVLLTMASTTLDAKSPPAKLNGCQMKYDLSGAEWTTTYGIDCPKPSDTDGGMGTSTAGGCAFESTKYDCSICCVLNTIYRVTDWVFVAVILLAVIFVSMGAFNIITAGGNADKVNQGRTYILYAAIGVVVGLLAKAVPSIARIVLSLKS